MYNYDSNGNLSSKQTGSAMVPVIVSQNSIKQIVEPGQAFVCSVGVASAIPVAYQWYFNGAAIPGATSDSFLVPNFASSNNGSYTVTVSNAAGSVNSVTITTYIDANGNGLPDDWELANFGNLNQTADGDFNGNSISNLQEFLNGTDPTVQQETNYWVAASGNFNDPANWSLSKVPGVGDNAIISSGTFTLPASGVIAAGRVIVNVPFTVPAGSDMTLNISGVWTFSNSFTLAAGQLFTLTGGGTMIATGETILGGGNLQVNSGSTASFPNVTSYAVPAGMSVQWETQSDGTVLSFPNLTTITGPATPNTYFDLLAHYGGSQVSLPALTTITKADDGDGYANSGVRFTIYDGAFISAPALSIFSDNDSHPNSSLNAFSTSTLSVPMLFAPRGVNINLNDLSHPEQFTSLMGTNSFQINAGAVVMSNLDSIASFSAITVSGGAQVSFPNVTSYAVPAGMSVQWETQSDGTVLSFPNLTTITGPATPNTYFDLLAHYGNSELSLPVLATITKSDDGDGYANSGVRFTIYDGAVISVPVLSTFNDNDGHPNSSLNAFSTSVLFAPLLVAPEGVNIDLNAQSNPSNFTSLARTNSFQINAGAVVMSNLDSIASFSAITVSGGAQVSFPNVTSYAVPAGMSVQWETQSDGTVLSFPNLTTITGPATPNTYFDLLAHYGGSQVSLPALTTITKADDGDGYANSGVRFTIYDGAFISAPALSIFSDNDSHPNSSLNASGGGIMILPDLDQSKLRGVTLNGVVTGANGSYPVPGTVPSITSITNVSTQVGTPFSYQITATNSPTTIGASGLPSGLSVDSTGLINGTPTSSGIFDVGLYAAIPNADGTAALILTVLPASSGLAITSGTSTGGQVGQPFSYQITATNNPTSFGATGLPPGLTINTATGVISGIPTQTYVYSSRGGFNIATTATYAVVVTATGADGTYTTTLTLSFSPAGTYEPVITSTLTDTVTQGQPYSYQITATNSPISYVASGLPAGLSFDSTSGSITGVVNQIGSFSISLEALNSGGAATATLVLNVVEDSPTVTLVASSPNVTIGSGEAGVFTVHLSFASEHPVIISYKVKGNAINGTDYALLTGTKKIKAGKISKVIKIEAQGNLEGASNKTVKLVLKPAPGYTVGLPDKAKITIYSEPAIGSLVPLVLLDDAENGLGDVTISPAGTNVIATLLGETGEKCYQLNSVPTESMTLNPIIVPATGSTLQFKSQLDYAEPGETAEIQISTDGGTIWTDLWSQNGTGGQTETAFVSRSIDLSKYAGQECLLRFTYSSNGGEYYPRADGAGWYMDDIEVIGAQTPFGGF